MKSNSLGRRLISLCQYNHIRTYFSQLYSNIIYSSYVDAKICQARSQRFYLGRRSSQTTGPFRLLTTNKFCFALKLFKASSGGLIPPPNSFSGCVPKSGSLQLFSHFDVKTSSSFDGCSPVTNGNSYASQPSDSEADESKIGFICSFLIAMHHGHCRNEQYKDDHHNERIDFKHD